MDAGIGYSQDGGKTWKRTLVPFQKCNGGFTQGVCNLSLSYSSDGSKLYLASKCENTSQDTTSVNQASITVTLSTNNGQT